MNVMPLRNAMILEDSHKAPSFGGDADTFSWEQVMLEDDILNSNNDNKD